MKRLSIIICIFTCALASGQSKSGARAAISADIISIIMDNNLGIDISHSFSSKWSAEGRAEIPIFLRSRSGTELEHDSLLTWDGDPEKREPKDSRPGFMIGIKYWPAGFRDGTYIGAFCSHNLRTGTDIAVGCGYTIRIRKHFGINFGYRVKLLECTGSGIFHTEGITIGIDYIF